MHNTFWSQIHGNWLVEIGLPLRRRYGGFHDFVYNKHLMLCLANLRFCFMITNLTQIISWGDPKCSVFGRSVTVNLRNKGFWLVRYLGSCPLYAHSVNFIASRWWLSQSIIKFPLLFMVSLTNLFFICIMYMACFVALKLLFLKKQIYTVYNTLKVNGSIFKNLFFKIFRCSRC